MKLIPLLLYVVSLGLLGLAGWTVYQMLPIWKVEVRDNAQKQGQKEGSAALDRGRTQGPQSSSWSYTRETAPWWAGFKDVNLIGKLPPPPPDPTKGPDVAEAPKPIDVRPLETLIELVSLVSDGETGGKGGNSHVIVRFKPEANVQPPEWAVKENNPPAVASATARDAVPSRPPTGGKPAAPPPPAPAGKAPVPPPRPSSFPASMSGKDPLQKLWVQDDGDPRRSNVLWPMRGTDGHEIGKIRLVRVADDAQSAFFIRELPPPKPGEAAIEPKEEELIKTAADLSQDIARIIRELNGKRLLDGSKPAVAVAPGVSWENVAETTRVGNNVHISRKDQQRFRDNSEDFVGAVTLENYVSRTGSTKGLIVKAVDSRLSSYGISPGEVLLEINGRKVQSKADAVTLVKGDYNRGVRTFSTKWLSSGQEVVRVYQAPPER